MPNAVPLAAALLSLVAPASRAQHDPTPRPILIHARNVITGTGQELHDASVLILDGSIQHVGNDIDPPPDALSIHAHTVMPGLIHPASRFGLPSYNRSGVHADRSADDDLFPDNIDTTPLLRAGFTSVCFLPDGSGLPGRAAIYSTESTPHRIADGPFPCSFSSLPRDKQTLIGAIRKARDEIRKVEDARKKLEQQQQNNKENNKNKESNKPAPENTDPPNPDDPAPPQPDKEQPDKPAFVPPEIDPAHRPIADMIQGTSDARLLISIRRASDLLHLDDAFARALPPPDKAQDQPHPPALPHDLFCTSPDSSDYHEVLDALASRSVTICTTPQVGTLPYTATRYNLPAALHAAGATIALAPRSDRPDHLRSFLADTADLVRHGLPRDAAIAAITRNVAALLRIDDRTGTIQPGKRADLILLDNDPFTPAARVTHVLINGRTVWSADDEP